MTEIWVDGSFTDIPSWAILVKQAGIEVYRDSGLIEDKNLNRYRQVIGELTAAKNAINWCIQNKVTEVNIFYDYEGIHAWANHIWNAKNPITKEYMAFMDSNLKNIKVQWTKVKAHSGNKNNDEVDKLAKLHSSISISEIENGIILVYKTKPYKISFKDMTIENV